MTVTRDGARRMVLLGVRVDMGRFGAYGRMHCETGYRTNGTDRTDKRCGLPYPLSWSSVEVDALLGGSLLEVEPQAVETGCELMLWCDACLILGKLCLLFLFAW